MSEIFTVVTENQAVTAGQDILAVYASATKKLQFLYAEMAANGQTTVGNYPMRIRALTANVASGSGGASVTPNNINTDNGAAISATARRNDTTHASMTSGTPVDVIATQFNPINGYYWTNPNNVMPGDEPKVPLSGAFVLSLDSVTGTLNISATAWFREI